MNLKHVTLPCPTCEFSHDFKREAWFEGPTGLYVAIYETNDMKSRKECRQELVFGVSPEKDGYETFEDTMRTGFPATWEKAFPS